MENNLSINPQIEESWKRVLIEEFQKPYFVDIKAFLKKEKELGKRIFPLGGKIFRAFDLCPFEEVKVVILGQDPYHGEGQAEGLSFSVPNGIKIPPSLRNIFMELKADVGIDYSSSGNLERWAKQGVLLLNTSLTVEENTPGSHSKIGWEKFTNSVIDILSKNKLHLVFILWGAHAISKSPIIDVSKHLILSSAHPSPLSAHKGFFGTKPFSKTNSYLSSKGIAIINW